MSLTNHSTTGIPPLIQQIKDCTICAEHLPLGPKPILQVHPDAKIAIIGQAPGQLAHKSGIPWDDPSGRRLREWLGVSDEEFYDPTRFGIVPMGFCYPGKGKGGDMPPRPECAPKWHAPVMKLMPGLRLTILIGAYAQKQVLASKRERTLTATVQNYEAYLPAYFVLPHPSPRNQIFLRKNPWIEVTVVPHLRSIIRDILS